MKESWIETLIELLNEYNEIHNYAPIEYYDDETNGFETNYVAFYKTCIIISKQFWFIKWLVENEKIDKRKIDTRLVRNVESHYDEDWCWVENSYEDYSNTNTLLMLLSIQDEPIEFLISILK